jgi:acid stress chaperone HdeA
MKKLTLVAIGSSAPGPAATSERTAALEVAGAGPVPTKMTSAELVMLDDVETLKVVRWAEGSSGKDMPEGSSSYADSTDRLVPVLLKVCRQAPKESFWKRAKAELSKVF